MSENINVVDIEEKTETDADGNVTKTTTEYIYDESGNLDKVEKNIQKYKKE